MELSSLFRSVHLHSVDTERNHLVKELAQDYKVNKCLAKMGQVVSSGYRTLGSIRIPPGAFSLRSTCLSLTAIGRLEEC